MATKKTRLMKAEEKYCEQLHEWLTNPKNEDLPNEIVQSKIEAAFHDFFTALIADEEECAEFISGGGVMDEMKFLPMIFEHFKSKKIYEAIASNCEMAFAQKHSIESEDLVNDRKSLLSHMQNVLGLV